MKQRIAVRALVKKDEKLLLLRRSDGRSSILGKYEFPGGRVDYGEQPEDALARLFRESIGINPKAVQLSDVLTYIDPDDRGIQYAVICYAVGGLMNQERINLGANYDKYEWKSPSEGDEEDLTELTQLLLNMHMARTAPASGDPDLRGGDDEAYQARAIVYSDGGSRGNPGPSAAGYVITDQDGALLDEGGAYLGITTNNQAEYHGVHLGLEKARELGIHSLEFRLDSLLVTNQLKGQYVIRNRELWPIHERIRELLSQFDRVVFRHVKREYNQRADAMVNKILDEHTAEKV